ncbi:MAG: UxaA family hydrolase [Planctomycetes bacterium]|nr:UxaA family hydrolase [Planctomycetota bacterium]
MTRRALVIHPQDNVVNLIGPGNKDDVVTYTVEGTGETGSITLLDDIPANHKFARLDMRTGDAIIKYGLSIGRATKDIRAGQYVHVHNVESNRGRGDLRES